MDKFHSYANFNLIHNVNCKPWSDVEDQRNHANIEIKTKHTRISIAFTAFNARYTRLIILRCAKIKQKKKRKENRKQN